MKLESGIRKSIERDENGNVINEIFFDETRNVKVMSIEYEYNPDGKVKKETLYDGFSNCVEILYSYDERGNCTEIRETEYNNGKQSYCHIRHNYYDNKNSMCMRIHVPFFVHLLALYLCQYKQRGIIMDNINEQCLETNMQNLSTLIETQYHENNKRKNQLEEDSTNYQIALKEYIDPFTGNKNKLAKKQTAARERLLEIVMRCETFVPTFSRRASR